MITKIEGFTQCCLKPFSKNGGFNCCVSHMLDNGKLVASQAGDRRRISNA